MPSSAEYDWSAYYASLADRPVRPLLTRALRTYGVVAPGDVAVDVGCGQGTETRALLDAGFAVVAVDGSPDAMALLSRFPEAGAGLTLRHAPMQDAVLPRAHLVYAGYSLPFCPTARFADLWTSLRTAVHPGGLLACNLFGDRDAWADEPDLTFVTRDEVTELLAGLDLVSLEEVEEEGRSFSGPKHWHRFEMIARA